MTDLLRYLAYYRVEIRNHAVCTRNKIEAIKNLRAMFNHDGSRDESVPDLFWSPDFGNPSRRPLGLLEAKLALEAVAGDLY